MAGGVEVDILFASHLLLLKLMFTVDPKGSRKLDHVMRDLKPYFQAFAAFCDQHLECNKDILDGWSLEEYLTVNENFHVLTRIVKADEAWGELKFKCNCKRCFIHCCCGQSLAWSMVLNPKLIMPPKYAKLSPNLRKKKGRPTAKRIELLKALQADARPFVDKAKPRVCQCLRLAFYCPALTSCCPMQTPVRVRAMEWSEAKPTTSSIVCTHPCI
jgi:hypothetical protein